MIYKIFRDQTNNYTHSDQSSASRSSPLTSSSIINAAITRTRNYLFNDTFIPWKFHPRNSDFEPPSTAPKLYITEITLQQTNADPPNAFKPLDGYLDESYTLTITQTAQVTLTSTTSAGLLHALSTLTKLL